MPVVSLITGKKGSEHYKSVITEADPGTGLVGNAIDYGKSIQVPTGFILMALGVFLI